ncbi:hypothetical protein I79_019795 [Cricetulus griseus]|uniref:Uncharacterized protein n=1 Tax=Cricetulus griseus TaxID=10029 RepID=G3I8D1_CRIGR|nr:hypothetical protein I79_019795 [Cricetulus griseus]
MTSLFVFMWVMGMDADSGAQACRASTLLSQSQSHAVHYCDYNTNFELMKNISMKN